MITIKLIDQPMPLRASARVTGLRAPGESGGHALGCRVYFLSSVFFSIGAWDADFTIDVIGTMMWTYGVPFHITHGPPLDQSVG
jgi:hypothetical protein